MTDFDTFSLHQEEGCLVNDEPISSRQTAQQIWQFASTKFLDLKECPFCRNELHVATNFDSSGKYVESELILWDCMSCGFWQTVNDITSIEESPPSRSFNAHAAVLRRFDELPDSCASELAQALRRQPMRWHTINPTRLEHFVADVFKANHRRAEVRHVGKSNDGGVDVLFVDASRQQHLIQVKRRERPTSSEGVSTLRNLIGAMVIKNVLRGVIVSTADHFTTRALTEAKVAKRRGFVVQMVDRSKLNLMVSPLIPREAWLPALKQDGISEAKVRSLREQLKERINNED
jgi:hypothetical protein